MSSGAAGGDNRTESRGAWDCDAPNGGSDSLKHLIEEAPHDRVADHDVLLPALARHADFNPGDITGPQQVVGRHTGTIWSAALRCQDR